MTEYICTSMARFDVDGAVYIVKMFSVASCLVSIGCTWTGAQTLKYSAPHFRFPYSTGSGVWTGILTFVIAMLGLSACKHFNRTRLKDTQCRFATMYGLVVMDIICAILHVTFSAIGFSNCYSEIRTGKVTCNAEERPRLVLMEGFNMAFGLFIVVVSMVFAIYLTIGRKFLVISGIQEDDAKSLRGCHDTRTSSLTVISGIREEHIDVSNYNHDCHGHSCHVSRSTVIF